MSRLMRNPPWWTRALGFSGGLAVAIVGVLIATGAGDSADEWGPWVVVGLVVVGVVLFVYVARQARRLR